MKTIKAFFKWSFIITGTILFMALVWGGLNDSSNDNGASDMSEVEAAPAAVTKDDKKKDSIRNAEREQMKKERAAKKASLESKVANLKRNFIISKDEIREVEFYTHKTFGANWQNYKTITTYLNHTGYIYFESNYHAKDWIFHDKITVKIADHGPVYTEEVPSYSENNRTENNSNGVYERVTFKEANHIIEDIAKANPSDKITIRFHGRQYYDDATMGPKTKQAFKQTYELSEAIKELRSL